MLNSLFVYKDFAPLLIRLMLGAAFVVHGYPKLFGRERRQGFAEWLESLGLKPGKLWAFLSGGGEFFGGIALIFGLYTQVAAILIAINMLVAMWKAKWGQVGFAADGGWEIDLAYLVMALSLLLSGAGVWSLDSYFLRFY